MYQRHCRAQRSLPEFAGPKLMPRGYPYGVGLTDDPEINARIRERAAWQILLDSFRLLCDTPPASPQISQRRARTQDAKTTWAGCLKALDR
jgi:hypothetical protein